MFGKVVEESGDEGVSDVYLNNTSDDSDEELHDNGKQAKQAESSEKSGSDSEIESDGSSHF